MSLHLSGSFCSKAVRIILDKITLAGLGIKINDGKRLMNLMPHAGSHLTQSSKPARMGQLGPLGSYICLHLLPVNGCAKQTGSSLQGIKLRPRPLPFLMAILKTYKSPAFIPCQHRGADY